MKKLFSTLKNLMEFLGGLMVGIQAFTAVAQAQSLVRELRSCKQCDGAQNTQTRLVTEVRLNLAMR